jgi:flagellar assembly protein FliH
MGGVIKANPTEGNGTVQRPHGASFQFEDLSRKAEAYLAEVRQKAVKLVEEAQADAVRIRSEAMDQGRKAAQAAAEKALKTQFDQQVKNVLPAIAAVAKEVAGARHVWAKGWEMNLVKLSMAIAKRVIRRELSSNPEITLDFVREAIDLASGAARVRISLNPTDFEVLKLHCEEIKESLKDVAKVDIVPNPNVAAGGCKLETEYGEIDQQVATQLGRIEKELLA